MAKSKIQFQKGFSLTRFYSQYGTEEQCRAALFLMRWPKGFECPECGYCGYCQIQNRKLYQCHRCHHQTSLICGTIFSATKLPMTTWLLGIYFITQAKNGISALEVSRLLGISANAAMRMKHKIQQVMKERDDTKPLKGLVLVDDAYWGGKKRDGKRGRGATDKMPFVAALKISPEGHPLSIKFNPVKGFTKREISLWGTKHIVPGSLVVSDGLNCFTGFKEADSDHEPIITGSGAEYDEFKVFPWLNTMIGNVKTAIHGTYRSISKEHFPRYLAEFNYRFNRRFQLEDLVDRFVSVALRTAPLPQRFKRLLILAEV